MSQQLIETSLKLKDKNISFFKQFHFDIYQKIISYGEFRRFNLQFINGNYFDIYDLKTKTFIYKKNPYLLIEDQLAKEISTHVAKAIFIGTHLGFYLARFDQLFKPKVIYIIEPVMEFFLISLQTVDYATLFSNKLVFLSIDETENEILKKFDLFKYSQFFLNSKIEIRTLGNLFAAVSDMVVEYHQSHTYLLLQDKFLVDTLKTPRNFNVTILLQEAVKAYSQNRFTDAKEKLLQILTLELNLKEIISDELSIKQIKDYIELAYFYLGLCEHQENNLNEALYCYERCLKMGTLSAIELDICKLNYSKILHFRDFDIKKAISLLGDLVQKYPRKVEFLIRLADLHIDDGYRDKAVPLYERAIELAPENHEWKFRLLKLAPVNRSEEEIDQFRTWFCERLDEINAQNIRIKDPHSAYINIFYFAYHGRNNKEILTKLSKTYEKACPELLYKAPHINTPRDKTKPIRIGFISAFFYHHPVGKFINNIIIELSKLPEFEVFVFSYDDSVKDQVFNDFIAHDIFEYVNIKTKNIFDIHPIIAGKELDILYYADIGMEYRSYFLGHARLARKQLVVGGHPETTGIGNIDYFINHKYEAADESIYREKILSVKQFWIHYDRPSKPKMLEDRKALNIPDNKTIFMVPVYTQKLHPEYDYIIRDILHNDSSAQFVLFKLSSNNSWHDILLERMKKVFDLDRITFLTSLPSDKFMNALQLADVVLEPTVFGLGTTAIQSYSIGIPIVNVPSMVFHGRGTYAYSNLIKVTEANAKNRTDYINKAIHYAHNPEERKKLGQKIMKNSHMLYENSNYLDEMANTLKSVL